MADGGRSDDAFTVRTIELDLPPLVGAFGRRLHEAGLPVTPARLADLARALTLVHPITRRRLYWTVRAVLVTDPTQAGVFDRVFWAVFGDPAADAPPDLDDPRTVPVGPDERPAAAHRTRSPQDSAADPHIGLSAPSPGAGDHEGDEAEVPVAMASDDERLAGKRFDALEAHELARLHQLMSRLQLATPQRRTRRYERGRGGQRVDLRRTLRTSLRTGGDPIRLARRRRRVEPRRLVMLCDISGSMEPYARAYLQFLTCARAAGPNAEAFAFATQLTRLTRALGTRQPERAIQRAAAAAPDWSSGTRIADALAQFNDRHGRRGMARGAVVVILSDGWERGDPAPVALQMQRLSRLAHRIVWVNPRVSADAFSVRAGGMVAALPYCDALVSGHSFDALSEVVEAIGAPARRPRSVAARSAAAGSDPTEEPGDEPWASATPVPGSSVAMPSGHGPSRGRTTPGWGVRPTVTDDASPEAE